MTAATLAERVPDLGAPRIPAARDGVRWRAATIDDVDALHVLYSAAAKIDHPHFTVTREEVADDLEVSFVDNERDTLLAELADGTVVAAGVAMLPPAQDTARRVSLHGTVHPSFRGRGLGRELLAWLEARGTEQLRAIDATVPGQLHVWLDEGTEDARRLLARAGFSVARWFIDQERDLAAPVTPVDLEGYTVVQLTDDRIDATRLARNDAFRDHWGSQPTSAEGWQRFITKSTMRPDLSTLALDRDGAIAGFVIAEHNPEDTEAQGFTSTYIALVGVVRAHRRRGVASAVLAATLQRAAAAGLEKAVLDVDSDSPTGANGLYAGVGFVPSHRSLVMAKEW